MRVREFVTTEQAAELLGVHVRTVRKLLDTKILDGEKRSRGWVVFVDSIHRRIDEKKQRRNAKHRRPRITRFTLKKRISTNGPPWNV